MRGWLKLSAFIDEHPKLAALPSDAARWAFVVLLCRAKRQPDQGRFASEQHLREVMGTRYRWVPAFRSAALLDGLAVHDWEDWQRDPDPNAAQRARASRERSKRTVRETNANDDRNVRAAFANVRPTRALENENDIENEILPPPPPAGRGARNGSPRDAGTNPRRNGTSPRQVERREMARTGDILGALAVRVAEHQARQADPEAAS